jgi:hypothetical protein
LKTWDDFCREVANELWIAREILSKNKSEAGKLGAEVKWHDANASCHTWSSYCAEIGINYTTANRWLNQWFPESLTLENKPLVSISNLDVNTSAILNLRLR